MTAFMILLRSFIFNLLFYGGTILIGILCAPTLLMSQRATRNIGVFWGVYTNFILRYVTGIHHRIKGDKHLDKQMIYAAKHQSAWETMSLAWHLDSPAIVLKQELTKIPLLGWMMAHSGAIGVDRDAGMKALKKLKIDAVTAKEAGRSLQIYPQGTRVAPDEIVDYQIGIYAIYQATNLPVVPIALNSGQFWGKRAFRKTPGTITVSFLPPIPPGLDRKSFMAQLENAIETEMKQL